MRCTKCGFISFDFNQVCPKCNRELADEQKKLNLPPFRPDPPQLLTALIGSDIDSENDIHHDNSVKWEYNDIENNDGMGDSLSGLTEDDVPYLSEDEPALLSLEPDEDFTPLDFPENESLDTEIDLDLNEISMEDSKKTSTDEIKGADKHSIEEDEDISFSLEGLSFDDLEIDGHTTAETGDDIINEEQAVEDLLTEEASPAEINPVGALYFENNAEGLTKEIDMKKFRKDSLSSAEKQK
jgi:hypothetical protein